MKFSARVFRRGSMYFLRRILSCEEVLESCGSVQRCGSCDILRRIILFQKKINISKTVLILCCYFDAELSYHNDHLRHWMTGLGRPGLLWTSAMWDSSCSETKARKKSVNRRSKQGGSCVDHRIILIQETWQYMYVSNCIYIIGLLNVM